MDGAAYRYPGSRPFHDTELDRKLFWGRARESHALLHLVLAEKLVVLFARSGMGKSSLINAGILEPLRERRYLPLTVRVNDPEGGPLHSVYKDVEEGLHRAGVALCTVPGGRLEGQYELSLDDALPPRGELAAHCVRRAVPLWLFFKEAEIWRGDVLCEPVLVCDQFEELFTLQTADRRAEFIDELAALVRERMASAAPAGAPAEELKGPSLKVVLALREDWLGSLEELASKIPGILATRFRLEPLTREQAREAIERPAALADRDVGSGEFGYAPEAVEAILDFLSRHRVRGRMVPVDEVEPSQLQIVCQHLERLVRQPGHSNLVTLADLGGKEEEVPEVLGGVLETYYEEQIARIARGSRRRVLRRLCETGLILDGRRTSVDQAILEKSFGVTADELGRLTDSRLLRAVPRLDSVQYELSHDTLVGPILAVRDKRLRRRNRLVVPLVAAAVLAVTLASLFYSHEKAATQKALADATTAVSDPQTDPVARLAALTLAVDIRGHESDDASKSMQERLRTSLEEIREIRREAGGVLEPAGQASCSGDGTTPRPEGWPADCVVAAYDPDDPHRLAATDRRHRLLIWNARRGGPKEISDTVRSIRLSSVAVAPDRRKIVTGSADGTLRVWSVRDAKAADRKAATPDGALWRAHERGRVVVAFSPKGRLASGGEDAFLKLWDDLDADSPNLSGRARGPGSEVRALEWSPDGRWIAAGGGAKVVLWDTESPGAKTWELPGLWQDTQPIAFDPHHCDGASCRLAGCGTDGTVTIFDLSGKGPVKRRELPYGAVGSLAWSHGGLLAIGTEKAIRVWTVDEEARPQTVTSSATRLVAFDPTADYLVAAGSELQVWEYRDPSFVPIRDGADGSFSGNPGAVSSLSFAAAGGMLVASSFSGMIKVIRGELSNPQVDTLDGTSHHFMTAVAFSADGSLIVTGSSDGAVSLWESDRGEFQRSIVPTREEEWGAVGAVAFSRDGGSFAAGGADGTLRIWDLQGNPVIGPLRGHGGRPILALAFSPDGATLESRGQDGTVRFWDLAPLPDDIDTLDEDRPARLVSEACKRLEHHPLVTGELPTDLAPEVLEQVQRRCGVSS